MGEFPSAIEDGTQEALMPFLTSINIACGGHAGDEGTMRSTIQQALTWKLAIGAHPGYPDRENFGRVEMNLPLQIVEDSIFDQIRKLDAIAAELGVRITHVKPHGALYNQAAKSRELAAAIAKGVARWSRNVVLVGLAGSVMLEVVRESGFRSAAEAFVDRRYEPDGSLRSRKLEGALITDPAEAAEQALSIVERGSVKTSEGTEFAVNADILCLHGDSPRASQLAAAVAHRLQHSGFVLKAFARLNSPGDI